MRKAALPLGIALVGGGAMLLFIAFHNLPSNVENLPELISWMAANIRSGKSWTKPAKDAPDASSSSGGGGFQIPALPPMPLPGFPLPVQ